MKCHMVRDRLSGYLDGELAEAEAALLASHLESCALCRGEADDLRQVDRALRALAREESAPEMIGDLRQRLAAGRPGSSRWVWAGAAGALAVAAGASLLIWSRAQPGPGPAAPRQSAVGSTPRPVPPAEMVRVPGEERQPGEAAEAGPSRPASGRGGGARRHRLHGEPPAPTPSEDLPGAAGGALPALQPQPTPAQIAEASAGIILILGEPQPVLPSSRCFIEVTRGDGSRSSVNQVIERDADGRPSAVDVSYQESGPKYQTPSQGG